MDDVIKLTGEEIEIVRDENGVPVEWTLLKSGETRLCQEGADSALRLTAEDLAAIAGYFLKKGEYIPVDSEHYLFDLAEKNHMDEAEALKLFPGGVAALGYGTLTLAGENLRIRVKWTDAAYGFLKEKIYKYFSPVIRGLKNGPLRVTSVAMTNTPAINHLDALAASANHKRSDKSDRKDSMGKLEKALGRLLGRDTVALEAETKEEEKDKLACEVDEKASIIEQVKALLGLAPEAGPDEIAAALKAEMDKAKSADEKQEKIDELAACAEKTRHAELVARGRTEGKIVDADMEYVAGLDAAALSAHLAHCPVKVPAGRIPLPERGHEADSCALTAEDENTIRRMRLDREKYIKAKQERNLK